MDIKELCNELNDSLENLLKEESTYFKSKEEIINSILEEFHITDINEFIKTIDNKEHKEYFENFFDEFNVTIDSFLCLYEMVEKMISNSDSFASEILENVKNNGIDNFDDYIIYYVSEKLNIEKDLLNEKNLPIRDAFVEKKFDNVKEEFIHKLISKLDNKIIDELIDKSSGFLEELCSISENNDFFINDLTEDTIKKIISNKIRNFINLIPDNMLRELNEELVLELLKKANFMFLSKEKQVILTSRFSFKTIFLSTKNYPGNVSTLFSMYDEIDSESFDLIIENKYFSNINNNKFIMSNKEYIKRIIDSGYFIIVLYLNEDMLDDEIFNILKSKCSDFGNAFEDYFDTKNISNLLLFKSKKNLLKIANITYTNFEKFLKYVPEEYLKDAVLFCTLNGMKEPTDIKYQQYYKNDLESIKHALELGYNFSYRTNITTKEQAELFIKRGYGQALDKLLSQKIKVSYELYRAAIENGYKFNDQFNISTIFESENDFCNLLMYLIESNNQEFLLKYMSYHGTISYNNQLISYFTYICCYINIIHGDMDFIDYLEKNGLLDGVLDILIYKYHTTSLCINVGPSMDQNEYISFDEIIKKRNENYNSIFHYLEFCKKVPEFIIKKEDVDKYFDEKGPTKLYYSKIMFAQYQIFNKLFLSDDYYKQLYSDEPYILSFIDFRKGLNLNYDWHKIEENLVDFFDENGPKQSLFDFALFDPNLMIIYRNKYSLDEIYPSRPEIKQYYNFRCAHYNYDFSNINIDNINEYFDKEGATKKLYDTVLFNNNLFNSIFYNSDIYITRYSNNPEVLQYIKFRLSNSSIIYDFINNYEDLNKYFNASGPTTELFIYALYNDYWFKALTPYKDKFLEALKEKPELYTFANFKFDNPSIVFITSEELLKKYFDENGPTLEYYKYAFESNDIKYFKSVYNDRHILSIYKDNPSVLAYSKFLNIYGTIFCSFIKYNDIPKYFNENGYTNELVNYFNQNKEITKNILSNLAHNDLVLNNINKDFVDIFKEYIISTFLKDVESPYEKYEYLVNNLGPEFLFNLDNPKIKKLLDFDKEQLDKLFNLFDKQATEIPNERVYSSFVQSLLTFKFKKEKREIVDVFTNINAIIVNTTEEDLDNILNNNLDSYLNEWITSISECLELDDTGLIELKNAIKECKHLNEQPLRDICRKFLEKTQKEYYEENKDKVLIELNLPITYDKQDANTKLYNYFLQNVDYENFDLIRKQLKNSFDYENVSGYIEQISMDKSDFELVLNLSEEKFDLIISAIRNKTKPADSVKKEFSLFKRVISQYSKYIVSNDLVDKELINTLNVKKSVKIPLEKIDMISILNELDLDIFINTVGNNEKILSNLNKLFSKYYIGRLPSDMGKNIENKYSITLPGGINNIGLFITRYYQLLLRKQKNLKNANKDVDIENIMFTFMELVELISASNSETYELKRLIGTNEYLDFISNKGPNSGQGSRLQREEKMGLIVDYLYSVDSVTIPSGDIIVEAGDKKINFIVGNRTNPANICHGERTGACMRVGGVGEGLFLKCITDKNWFHIRIEDPDTHEYVSRVSGFRNGNTVYLNQLRNVPAGCKYTNSDLQKFISEYAKKLVEQTKDSEYPIENVFINTGYAMTGYASENGKTYHLGFDIQKEYNLDGLFDLQVRGTQDIWTDVKNNAVLLATTEEGALTESGYVPLKNGPEQTEIYPVTRDKIYGLEYVETEEPKYRFVEVSNEDLFEKINRVHCMKAKLLGSDYRFSINDVDELNEDNYIVDGYASADWYVYIDNNKVIHTDFISEIKKKDEIISYAQAKEAQAEMNYYKQMLERKYNLDVEVKYAV